MNRIRGTESRRESAGPGTLGGVFMRLKLGNEKGFTLLEIILALAILGTAGAIALRAMIDVNTSFSETKVRQQVNEDARRIMKLITTDLRNAGFGVALNDLGNATSEAESIFSNAFESDYGGTDGNDGIVLRALIVGTELSECAPDGQVENSQILKVKSVKEFMGCEDGFVLIYRDGEYKILQIKQVKDQPNQLQHYGKIGWNLPPESPIYRVDQVEWRVKDGEPETITRSINATLGVVGKQTHEFKNVRRLKFKYIMKDGSTHVTLSNTKGAANNPVNLMCIEVTLDVYRTGGRDGREFHTELVHRVAPRNL